MASTVACASALHRRVVAGTCSPGSIASWHGNRVSAPQHQFPLVRPRGQIRSQLEIGYGGGGLAILVEADAASRNRGRPEVGASRSWRSGASFRMSSRAALVGHDVMAPTAASTTEGTRLSSAVRSRGSVLRSPIRGSRAIRRACASGSVSVPSRVLIAPARPSGFAIFCAKAATVCSTSDRSDVVSGLHQHVEEGGHIRRRPDDAKRLERLHAGAGGRRRHRCNHRRFRRVNLAVGHRQQQLPRDGLDGVPARASRAVPRQRSRPFSMPSVDRAAA